MAAVLSLSFAAAANAATAGWPLQEAGTDVGNLASLQRGARNFVNYCLGCHSAQYMRYSQLASDLALTEEELRASLMFTGTRIYDTMDSAMPAEQGRLWFGNAPPDLSLIARSRGPDYLYTFLRSFYADPSRPIGVNNAVLPGTAMPHVLAPLQGLQQPRFETTRDAEGNAAPRRTRPRQRARRPAGCRLRQLRARHGCLPRVRRRALQGHAPGARRVGDPVPADVHRLCLVPLQGILEGR
jgi:ubiquinol-cytochrome c reductase cytochrome c1 subunit